MESLESFISQYISRGFGSMNKNDFEVFIFGQILTMEEYRGKSNYELSILLRTPESKIKRLRYESALKKANIHTDYRAAVYKMLDRVQLRGEDKKIIFQVEDVMIKSFIASVLKKDGRMLDSSFNPELIVLHLNDFQYLAKEVYPEGEIDMLFKEAAGISKHSMDKPITWNDILGWVVQGTISGVASSVTTNLTPMGVLQIIKNCFQN